MTQNYSPVKPGRALQPHQRADSSEAEPHAAPRKREGSCPATHPALPPRYPSPPEPAHNSLISEAGARDFQRLFPAGKRPRPRSASRSNPAAGPAVLPTSRRRPAQAQGPAEHPGEGSTYVPVPLRRRRRLPGSLPDGAARPRPPQQRHRRRRGGGSSGPLAVAAGTGRVFLPALTGRSAGRAARARSRPHPNRPPPVPAVTSRRVPAAAPSTRVGIAGACGSLSP